MTGRRAIIGLSMLCALVFSATSVSSAAAATEGTTAFTCTNEGLTTKTFSDEHCTNETGVKAWGHKVIPVNTPTAVNGSNEKTKNETKEAESAVLLGTVAGIAVELTCKTVTSSGTQENNLTGEKHRILGSKIIINYSGCEVKKPAGKGCLIKEGKIKTNELTSESTNTSIVFKPPASGIFTEITIEKCETAALNGTFKVEGTVPATPKGATLTTTDAGSTATLKFAGQKAGLTQIETLRMTGAGGKPITTTGPVGAKYVED